MPGEKAFRDNSIYVTQNDDGTFNAYTIESVPGTDSGYLKQAGDKHASLDAAKNAAKKQSSDTTRSTRSTRSSRESVGARRKARKQKLHHKQRPSHLPKHRKLGKNYTTLKAIKRALSMI